MGGGGVRQTNEIEETGNESERDERGREDG